jgi:hypothetical protein
MPLVLNIELIELAQLGDRLRNWLTP